MQELSQSLIASQRAVESYNNIKILMAGYVENLERAERPLSLAVFGPPGSGKSFGIKQIASDISPEFDLIECNASQFTTPEDLNRVFFQVANVLSQKRIPLVFFDEFDSGKPGQDLIWLKFFLQPMQDGIFQHPDGEMNVSPAIFVFAGGTSERFIDFAKVAGKHTNEKGPDFVSRLRGHVDIPEINVRGGEGYSPLKKQQVYISRALLIRGLLRVRGLVRTSRDDSRDTGHALVDEDIVRAMLTVSKFHHGARSISAILDMCQLFGGWIVKASLPTLKQLNMHTNGLEFLTRVRYPHLHWLHERIAVFGDWAADEWEAKENADDEDWKSNFLPGFKHVVDPKELPANSTWETVNVESSKDSAAISGLLKKINHAASHRETACGFPKEHFRYELSSDESDSAKGLRFILMPTGAQPPEAETSTILHFAIYHTKTEDHPEGDESYSPRLFVLRHHDLGGYKQPESDTDYATSQLTEIAKLVEGGSSSEDIQ